MRIQIQVFTGVFVALLLIVVHSSEAQIEGRMTLTDIFATLKPGQWAQLEGIVRPDSSVQCTEVKILTGAMLDNDWTISGAVRKVNKEKQEVEILRLPIKVQPDTEFKEKAGMFKSLSDVKTKSIIKAYGTYMQDGAFLAKRLKDMPPEPTNKPDQEPHKVIEAVGKIENIDSTKRTITLMGITFQLTDRTKGKSVIK